MKKTSKLVYLAALLHALITGLSFVFTKLALEYTNPFNILGQRFIFAFLALIIILTIKGKLNYFNKENFKKVFPLALVYPLLFFGFQTFGLRDVDSSLGGILLATAPIFTLVLSAIFLKERPNKYQVFFVFLAVFGVVFIFYNIITSTGLGNFNFLGILLLLITTICFSTYSIMAKGYTKKYENLELLTVMISLGCIGFNLLALIINLKNNTIIEYFTPLRNIKYIASIFYLGVLSSLGTSMLTNYILQYITPAKMSVFSNLSTLISIFAGALFLNEPLYYYHILGGLFIILGVVGTNFYKVKSKDEDRV